MSTPKFHTVDEYLSSLEPIKARTIRAIITLILAEFPDLEARIAWKIPQIHLNGKYVAGICAYQKHLTFAPWSQKVLEGFKPRLGAYVLFKNCFQIPIDWEIDKPLVLDLVRARLAELK